MTQPHSGSGGKSVVAWSKHRAPGALKHKLVAEIPPDLDPADAARRRRPTPSRLLVFETPEGGGGPEMESIELDAFPVTLPPGCVVGAVVDWQPLLRVYLHTEKCVWFLDIPLAPEAMSTNYEKLLSWPGLVVDAVYINSDFEQVRLYVCLHDEKMKLCLKIPVTPGVRIALTSSSVAA
jgi:hypothetical protein